MQKFTRIIVRSTGILTCVIISFRAFSQSPDIGWQKEYGGSENDQAKAIIQTGDGGYMAVGTSLSQDDIPGHHGYADYWLMKLNASGDTLWTKCYGGSNYDYATSAVQTSDGGFVVAGYTKSIDGDVTGLHGENYYDYWVIRINPDGDTLWTRCYGGTRDDQATSVVQTDDGGFIIAGHTGSNDGDVSDLHGEYDPDYWLVRLNSDGDTLWTKCYGGTRDDHATSVVQTDDGGYVVAGYSNSYDGDVSGKHGSQYSSFVDYWIVKLNSSGDILWAKCLGGSNNDKAHSVRQADDDGCIVVGETWSKDGDITDYKGSADCWCVKLDEDGDIEWKKCFGGTSEDIAYSVQTTNDGGYIIAGSAYSDDGDVSGKNEGTDGWILKIFAHGYIQWQKCIGDVLGDYATAVIQTNDGGFALAGYSGSYLADYLLVKLENDEDMEIFNCGDTLTDTRDGRKYSTVKIANKSWMSSNLDYNDTDTFNYSAGICPEGWHLPTIEDWSLLNDMYSVEDLLPGGESGLNIGSDDVFWTSFKSSGPSSYTIGNTTYYCYNSTGWPASCWAEHSRAFPDITAGNIKFNNFLVYRSDETFEIDYSGYYYSARCVSDFFCPLDSFIIDAATVPPGTGAVEGTGKYIFGEKITLSAIPDENYNFINWIENDSIVSEDPDYAFNVYDNRYVDANYQIKPPAGTSLQSPGNGEDYLPSSILLQWRSSSRADTYQLQVSEDNDFETFIYNVSHITDTAYQAGPLEAFTTYYWRVSSQNSSGSSAYSEIWSFTVEGAGPPAIPVLCAPADDATAQHVTLTFYWRSDPKAEIYHLQVSGDEDFSGLLYNDSTITDTSFIVSSLEEYTAYYWRVRTKNATASSPYSGIYSFTTGIKPPSVPELYQPDNGSENVERFMALSWFYASGVNNYHLQVSANVDFSILVFEDSTITTTNFETGLLLNESTTYYWRVRAENSGGVSTWSETNSFTTGLYIINPPSLFFPYNGAQGEERTLTLSWSYNSGADTYHLQVAENEDFSSLVREDSTLTNTDYEIGPLDESTTYYWRVRAENTGGVSPWSETYGFTTSLNIINPPPAPFLYSPDNGEGRQPTTVELSWSWETDVYSYHLQVSEDENFTELIVNDSTITGTYQQIGPLENMTTYYWRVRTKGEGGYSSYSEIYYFITESGNWNVKLNECVNTINFISEDIGWAAGFEIFSTNDGGTTWNEIFYPSQWIKDIFFIDALTGWAAGWNGLIMKTSNGGYSWDIQNSGTTGNLESLYFVNALKGWAVGNEGIFSTTDGGQSWINLNTWGYLNAVYFINENAGFAAGSALLKTDDGGLNWHECQVDYDLWYSVNSVCFTDEQTGWAAGNEGILFKSTDGGETWTSLTGILPVNLNDVYFIDALNGWIVGDGGSIMRTTNGGNTWESLNSESSENIQQVRFMNHDTGWIIAGCKIVKTETGGGEICPLPVPILADPYDYKYVLPEQLTLSWYPLTSATSYRLQVSKSAAFSDPVFDQDGLTSNSQNIGDLEYGQVYYWHVNASNDSLTSYWSATRMFTTYIISLTAPVLSSPSDGSVDNPLIVTLLWNESGSADKYYLQVDDDVNFNSPVIDFDWIISASQTLYNLDFNTTYYWRVRALTYDIDMSPWSEIWSFTTIFSVGFNELNSGIQYLLYPNPADNILFISGFEDESKTVTIQSLDGQLFKILNGEGVSQLDISDLPDGIYLIKIVNKRGSYITKIVKQ